MKRLSSMLALGMALALTFGMTVCAAESSTTENPDYTPSTVEKELANQVLADSKTTEVIVVGAPDDCTVTFDTEGVSMETVAEVIKGDVVNSALERMGETGKAQTVADLNKVTNQSNVKYEINLPVAAVEISASYVPEGGLTFEIESPKIQPDDKTTYVVMHLNSETGLWEILVPEKIENGKVTVKFTSLSPAVVTDVVIVPVGEEKDDDDDPEPWLEPRHPEQTGSAASPATSPKTAETLPVAGVIALIALAGAAVCAGKIRYNK